MGECLASIQEALGSISGNTKVSREKMSQDQQNLALSRIMTLIRPRPSEGWSAEQAEDAGMETEHLGQ